MKPDKYISFGDAPDQINLSYVIHLEQQLAEKDKEIERLRGVIIKYLQGRPNLSTQSPLQWDMKLREEMEQALQDKEDK